jgi:pentatricopeptide repeat protein
MELDTRTRKAYAYRLLVYLLDRKPDRALRFVQVLANDPLLRRHENGAIADALGHLSKVHAAGVYGLERKWGADPALHKRLFVPAFVHVFETALSKQPKACSQDLLYNLVQLAETEDLKKVFDCLIKHRTYLGFDTVLHYASTFGEAGQVEYALRCLDELKARHSKAWDSVVERTRLRRTCATILRKSMSQSENFHSTPLVVAALVRLGIKMDVLLYNIVMHNAMEAGDYATAFKVYNALESNGLKADKHTFSILLHGCTLQSNPGMFQSFAQYCAEVAKKTKDAWLATDHLYYLYVRHQTDTEPEHASALLWQAYTSFFSTTLLRLLIDFNIPPTPDSTNLPPPPVALYIMLQTEIRTASSISNQRVLNLYQRFLSLASSSSIGPFRALIQDPTIWNAFLLAFCHAQQFSSAANLIRDMSSSSVFANPNIYTWNIFMQAFFKTGQVAAAERVFEILRSRNVEPDQFTYGVLLRGYAKGQMVERVGETMQRIESEEELDPDLMRALATVVDRRRLMLTLEQSRILKETQAQEGAENRAEEERVRWQPPRFELGDVEETMAGQGEEVGEDSPTPKTGEGSDEVVEDEALFGFLSDDERVDSATPPALSASLSTPQPVSHPQPRIRTLPRNDPEVQYRLLQQQLGITTPSSPPAPEVKKVATFGAGLGFKSVLSKKDKGSEESSKGLGSRTAPSTKEAGSKKKSAT